MRFSQSRHEGFKPVTKYNQRAQPAGLYAILSEAFYNNVRKTSAVKPPRTNKGFEMLPNKPKPPSTDVLGGFGAPGGARTHNGGVGGHCFIQLDYECKTYLFK